MSDIRIVIVDDEELLRSGLRLLLDGGDIRVVGEAGNGREAIALIERERPDVVLMDIRMPVMSGIDCLPMLPPSTPVIMLTAFDTDEFIMAALRAGAVGFLLKTTPPASLIAAVRAVAVGQQILSPAVLERLLAREAASAALLADASSADADPRAATPPTAADQHHYAAGLACLTGREREIAELIAQGLSNADIAKRLFISLTTVKSHTKSILHKIGGTNRVHIVIAVLDSRR